MAGAVVADDMHPEKQTEIDAVVLRRTRGLVGTTDQIFVECKHGDLFGAADLERAIWLHKKFPAATICLATLREDFADQERDAILEMLSSFEINRFGGDSAYPLLILTDTELHSCSLVREVWKTKGGRWGRVADQSLWDKSLLQYCNQTQYLYLTSSDRADRPGEAVWDAVKCLRQTLPRQ